MALTIIKDQSEIRDRYNEAALRSEIEAFEYLRQLASDEYEIEDYREIDHAAKNCLSWMLRSIGRCRWNHARQVTAQYVAWKWMLGHPDADTFHGAHNMPKDFDPRFTYMYLRDQIQSGEWDRLTKESVAHFKSRSKPDEITENSPSEQPNEIENLQPVESPHINPAALVSQSQVIEAR